MQSLGARPTQNLAGLRDAEPARLARQRHAAACRLIIERNNRRLYRVARSILKDDAEAEDVVQEVYVLAFGKLAEFRAESSLATWLARIAVNEALGRLRRRRPSLELSALDAVPLTDTPSLALAHMPHHSDPERAAAHKQIRRRIERAIDELPDDFRAVFVMRDVEAISVAETADVLALSPATVKTRLHRARRRLRRALAAELASALTDTFPFDGERCRQTTAAVLARLHVPPSPAA
jgi:RNA polymerase sigma-70 factor, ECF subfamily